MPNESRKNDERILRAVDSLASKCAEHEMATKHMIDDLEKHEEREIAILERLDRNFATQTELMRSISTAQTISHANGNNRIVPSDQALVLNNKLLIILIAVFAAISSGSQFVGEFIRTLLGGLK